MTYLQTLLTNIKSVRNSVLVTLFGALFMLAACNNDTAADSSVATQASNSDDSAPQKLTTNASDTQQETAMTDKSNILLSTSLGDITIELDHDKAPISAKNFEAYAAAGHYNGVIFHRVIPNFMIQGGGFAIGMVQKPTQAPIVNEANNGLLNNKYTLAMARTSDPHSASSQFFINTKDNDFLNFSSETNQGWGYAVFGRVVDGFDVVDQIEKVATGQVGPHGDVPVTDVVIIEAKKL